MADDALENEDDWSPIRFREDEEMDFFTELALHEAERWIQAVTRKKFEHPEDFRKSLANGVLLCELLNNLKPGSVKRINKLPGAIAGLDNLNVFLSACEKNFGLKKTQLFDPNDLEDLSTRAISDDSGIPGSEYLLKQEVDRRARNVAVTVYWLGKSVANKYKGPSIDISAFGALVHSHGNKDIISDDCFRNGTSLNKDDSIDTSSNKHRHVRDSSYDSLGSYERESESSFDELDGSGNNMPVRSDMREMRRYGSASSLAMSRDLRLSTASGESAFSDNKDDSLYQSSPDLSHGSQVHTRSSSTDSAEGNYYGNHSRQSSGSTDYPTRRLSSSTTGRKTSTSTPDPLQFVKLKGADNLALQAKKQIEATKEVNIMRGKIDSTSSVSEEQDWQSNFNNWKSKRRKSAFGRLSDDLEEEPEKRTSQKTFSQIMAEKEKRRSAGPMNFYPLEDDDSGIGVKQEPSLTKSTSNNNESKPKPKKSAKEEVAPWAQGSSGDENNSQSDSETNNSHQSCDTDSVFSDKSTPSKILSDDDSWVKKTNAQAVSNKLAGHVKTQKPIGESRKLWENNVNESQKKDERKLRDLPSNSVKIKSLAQSYEQKEKEANAVPVVSRRSDFNRSSLSKSLDLSDHSFSTPLSPVDKKPPSPLSPNAPKALLPRDQRYSHSESSPKQQTPTRNKANRASSDSSSKSSPPPATPPKPSKSKIAAARALFEQTYHENNTMGKHSIDMNKVLPQKLNFISEEEVDLPTDLKNSEINGNFTNELNAGLKDNNENAPQSMKMDEYLNGNDVDYESYKFNSSINDAEDDNRHVRKGSDLHDIPESQSEMIEDQLKTNYNDTPRIVSKIECEQNHLNDDDEDDDDSDDSFDVDDVIPTAGDNYENDGSVELLAERLVDSVLDNLKKENSVELLSYRPNNLLNGNSGELKHDNDSYRGNYDFKSDNDDDNISEFSDPELPDELPVPESPKSPRAPALPTSAVPDIIVSGITDSSEESLYNTGSSYKVFGVTSPGPAFTEPEASDTTVISEHAVDYMHWTPDHSAPSEHEKFVEKTIKINQKPNNERGFGFFLTGGAEKKLPITVQRVSLGSAADVCEVEANDELLSINGRDVSNLAFAQVQGIVEHSVKRGEIVLKIKRYTDEDGYDSMEESLSPSNKPNNNNNNNIESKPETFNNRNHYQDMTDSGSFKPSFELSTHTDDQPRLMDQLIQEQKREANNKQDIRAPSPVQAESFTAEVSFNTKSVPKNEVTPPPQQIVTLQQQMVTPPRPTFTERSQDLSGPDDVTLTEERQTISVKPTVDKTEPLEEPVVMRRNRQPLLQDSPPPPTPPKSELPQLTKMNESPGRTLNDSPGRTVSVDASGFGPPAALLRWQQRRPKSEYQSSFSKPSESTFDKNKRLSSTLPFNSESPFSFGKDYSKDDSMLDKVNNDFMESVSVSKPVESKPTSYRFNDTSRIEEWQQKQEQQRMPETEQQRPPSFEVSIRTDDTLTAQSAAPTRKLGQVEAPYVVDLGIPADDLEMSTEEKFERDQQKIRQQYEEEKKRAREAEKLKQEQESKALNSDKFLRDMEAQIVQTKQEVTNQNPSYNEPMRTLGTEQRYSSEPMTIKLPSNSPGRQLVIDPRNQSNNMDNNIPEYSFRVDLPKIETAPPLRTFEQPSLTPQEILEQEKAKIREEEKRKFEEEKQKWKEEQEREMRLQQEKIQQERENLLREQKRVEQEKAMLERSKQDDYSYNTSSNNHLYVNPKTSSGPASLSPKSPPALDPKSRKAPPPTAPKPDKGNKARLTREDLLAMNRKATPLTKPDFPDGYSPESGSLSPTTREAPSKGELHSLNAVPKQKFRSSAGWIKEEEEAQNAMNERPFVIGNRSDLIHHRDNSNPSEHWVVREAEKRRLAEKNDRYGNSESVTAHAGPTKPSQSSLVSRFRGDIEPQPRSNRYSYPSTYSFESRLSPTSRGSSSNNLYNRNMDPGMTQFSAKTQPNTYASNPSLSQTLPPSFSFNANVRSNQDGSSGVKPPRSLSDDTGPVIAVSGKQKCSHCGEELGFGAAMVIESLGLYYHVQCFRCCVCRTPLGNGSEGTDVRVRVNKLHCKNCYSNDEEGLKFSKV